MGPPWHCLKEAHTDFSVESEGGNYTWFVFALKELVRFVDWTRVYSVIS